jgi:transcription factor IIIB subunit 2
VVPEDLIWRFASKLEFGELTEKVAEDAVRMVQRMSLDWMTLGRRPSGVCGACLILAARMNNFRRTITEVVYIVKVTTHTIQKRLDEFKMTPSSNLTVDEFLNHDFLESTHDPPSFYQQTKEFKATKKRRKRKGHDALNIEDNAQDEDEANEEEGPNKRPRTAAPDPEVRRDADGFAIPPIPSHAQPTQQSSSGSADTNIDPALRGSPSENTAEEDASLEEVTRQTLDDLAKDYANDAEEPGISSSNPVAYSGRGRPSTKQLQVRVSKAWENDERELESEMSELVSDPNTLQHAVAYAQAENRISTYLLVPESQVCMDVHIGEDEFAGDPEIENMILSPEEALIKEKIWINNNKDWLRLKQKKEFEKKLAEEGPPKAKRNRKKKPKIGEGHAPMDPADAAVQTMEKVKMTKSKKIDYQKLRGLFDGKRSTEGSAYGSSSNSRAGSEVGSVAGSAADTASVRSQSVAASIASETNESRAGSAVPESEGSQMGDGERGASVAPSERAESTVQEDDWRKGMQPQAQGDDEDELPEDNEDYVDTGFGDDNDSILDIDVPGGFDGPEDDYDE